MATSSGAYTLTLADNSASDSSVLFLMDNGSPATVPAVGLSNLVNTNAHVLRVNSGGNVTTVSNNALSFASQADTIAHTNNVIITGSQALALTTGASTTLALIDASELTGALTLTATTTTKSMVVKGGTGADTVTASTVSGALTTFIGGRGGDSITLNATAANSKGDVIRLVTQADSTASAFDKVTNFIDGKTIVGVANTDKLDLAAFGFAGDAADFFTGAGKVTITGSGTAVVNFTVSATNSVNFFVDAGIRKGVALATNSNETFVFIDVNHDGQWTAASDSVILLVGDYTSGTDLTLENFVF